MESKQIITKDMTIGEVVGKYPETASVMLSYGLHCVGCSVNPYETIENGCLGHGMDEKTVDKLVKEINNALNKKEKRVEKIISISKNAAKKFKEFMKDEGKSNFGVRLEVVDTGSTLQYGLDFAEKESSNEKVFEENGIKVFINKAIIDSIKGIEIDYIENERGSGFKIENPNVKVGGCGTDCGCHE